MINVTESHPSQHVLDRARHSFVRRLAADRYLVTPKEPEKTRRLVTFTLRGNHLFAHCCNYYKPEEQCPANQFQQLCCHVEKALQHATHLARRQHQQPHAA